jgi:2,3-bisphosphoglycerate-dependent phosphoglycerate mutase
MHIREHLQSYSPSKIIWDFEDLTKQPPWGNYISHEITSLANYFVTSEGDDLFDMLMSLLETANKLKFDLEIKSIFE